MCTDVFRLVKLNYSVLELVVLHFPVTVLVVKFKQTLQSAKSEITKGEREPWGEELDADWIKLQSRQQTSSKFPFGPKRFLVSSKHKIKTKVSEADSIYTGQTIEVAVELNTFSESK